MTRAASLLAVACGVAISASPLSAQSDQPRDPRVPPPVTWCDKPAPKPKWKRQTVSFALEIEAGDSSEAHQRLRPYLPFLLSGIAERWIAEHQPTRDINAPKTKNPPPGEPRYSPADVGRMVVIELRGDGTVDSVIIDQKRPSSLTADLKAAVLAAAARGDVFGPYADSSVRTRLLLLIGMGEYMPLLEWPAFTLYMPISRPVRAHPRNAAPGYPADALEWNGKLVFQYMVDENGRAVPETAKVLDSEYIVWKSNRQRQAFELFKRQVERTLPTMRFTPAELNGCYIRTFVQQEFVFTHNQ
jgi:hypothetical protein